MSKEALGWFGIPIALGAAFLLFRISQGLPVEQTISQLVGLILLAVLVAIGIAVYKAFDTARQHPTKATTSSPRTTRDLLAPKSGAPVPDAVIGNFQFQTRLGGMGEVWKAWDTKGGRPVVLKLIPDALQRSAEEIARVRATFQRIHALHHQHMCPLYLLDEDPQYGWYLVMQFIDGQTLPAYQRTYVARHGSFPVEQVVKVLRPVAEALDYAHRNRLIHRDIKPQNIMVVGDADDVQVVDFGLAAEIRTIDSRYSGKQTDISGTRPYMAPEQWKGQTQDARTDQYALAVVAYELLAGHLPFDVDDTEVLRLCVLNEPPEPIEGQPEAVNRALMLGLAKQRQERFASCVQLIEAVTDGKVARCVTVPPSTKAEADPKKATSPAPPKATLGPAAAKPQPVEPKVSVAVQPAKTITNSIGMKMLLIPAGEFMMGAAEGESHKAARPQHRVRITQPFYLSIYPVTQAEYQRMMGKNPSRFQGWKGILGLFASPPEPRRPVEQVWWESAVEFCRRLSEQEGVTYRLPTEAEWEYACRAGSVGRWCFGDDESSLEQYAWYTKNSGDSAHPVGRKKPNAWGLYDMHGNVLEWCEDWYGNDYYRQFADKVAVDPAGPLGGSTRVLRGGSWWDGASYCRSACRFRGDRGPLRFDHLGFRLARTVAAPPLAVAPFDVSAAQRYRQWLEKDLAELYASRPRKFHALTYQQWLVEYLAELNAANKSILVDSASATAKTPPAAATQAGNQSTGKPESSRGTYAASS